MPGIICLITTYDTITVFFLLFAYQSNSMMNDEDDCGLSLGTVTIWHIIGINNCRVGTKHCGHISVTNFGKITFGKEYDPGLTYQF
jgi:hypothetical protein